MEHVSIIMAFIGAVSDYLKIYAWRDCLEILVLATIVYKFTLWLSRDKTLAPISFFYTYSLLLIGTYYLNLSVVNTVLLFASPVCLVLMIVMHQYSLQKNVIAYKTIQPAYEEQYDWADELMRACLNALNKNKDIVCLIERSDNLKDLVQAPYYLNADLRKHVLELLFEHLPDRVPTIIWVHVSGKVVAINARCVADKDAVVFDTAGVDVPVWKQDALLLTQKTDALLFHISPVSRLFDVYIKGKAVEGLTAAHALTLLRHQLLKDGTISDDRYFNAYKNRSVDKHNLS